MRLHSVRWVLLLVSSAVLSSCAPAAPGPTPSGQQAAAPASRPTESPAAAPIPAPTNTVTVSPPLTPTPTERTAASPSPRSAPTPPRLYSTIADANAAYARKDFSTALGLYRQAAGDEGLNQALSSHPVPPGPELRAFARFRVVVADAVVGQEDDARATLDEMRQKDAGTAFLRLSLVFWDTYGMTAEPGAACARVTQLVRENPEPVLRSLNNWAPGDPKLVPEDICRLP
jgi:hypothetical protein